MSRSTLLLVLTILCTAPAALASPQGNGVVLLSQVDEYSTYNDVWGYTAPNGDEYVVLGTTTGTAIYNAVNPAAPYRTGFISGPSSGWRDMKTWDQYAYAVTEGAGGVQIISLVNPEAPFLVKTFGASIWSHAHNIAIDTGTGFAYVCGTDNGTHVLDLADPENPVHIATYNANYVHDLHVQNGQAHLSELYQGRYTIVDVTSLPSFPQLDTISTPNTFTHNTWVNETDTVAVATDEVGGSPIAIYDVSNPSNIQLLSTFTHNANSIPHNAFITGDKIYCSWYTEGLIVVDVSNPSSPTLSGSYDTSPLSGISFDGAWGCYPFAPSGVVYVSDIQEGLFILREQDPYLEIQHTPLGDTPDEIGPYVVSADIIPLQSNSVSSASVVYSVDGGAAQNIAMSQGAGNSWSAGIPGQASPAIVEYHIDATDNLGNMERDPKAGEHKFRVGNFKQIYFNDFEGPTDEGWTHAQIATQDDWQRDAPQGKSTDPGSAFSGTKVWANDVGNPGWNGEYAANVHNYLDSPVFDLTGETGVQLRFQRQLGVEKRNSTSNPFDTARILVNGTTVWENPLSSDVIDGAWTEAEYDISALADNNPSVQVRFELISDAGVQYGGWTLDDFELFSFGSSGNKDVILLTGSTTGSPGGTVSYSFSNAPPNSLYRVLYSFNLNGSVLLGHAFDLGLPVTIASQGTTDGAGNGSWTSGPLPPGAAGRTVFIEVGARDAGTSAISDSNVITLVIS